MITEAIKEHPILFSSPMVRAILANKKTQTRRVIPDRWWRCLDDEDEDDRARAIPMCPYGVVGERLWVRETLQRSAGGGLWHYAADGNSVSFLRKDTAVMETWWKKHVDKKASAKHAAIFMPRWASRITLEITDVRIERLQSIRPADAVAEGMPYYQYTVKDFAELWDSLNAKRGFGWSSNPFVWVLSFKRVDGEVK